MKKDEVQFNSATERQKLLETLFGPDDLIEDEQFCQEYLKAAGIDPSALIFDFQSHLEAEIEKPHSEAVSQRLQAAFESIQTQTQKSKIIKGNVAQMAHRHSFNPKNKYWTNHSVLNLADNQDPVEVITKKAQSLILDFFESKGSTPIDPVALAGYLNITVIPRENIRDARTIPAHGSRFIIEYNPNQSQGRIRYSICHEIIHTLFPDCAQRIRNRATHEEMIADEWQLEMLCNIGAAELLMPIGTFSELKDQLLSVEDIKNLQKEHKVSTEALLIRIAKLTTQQCGVFSASRKESSPNYRIDYAIPSQTWPIYIPSGLALPQNSVVANCTAIWYTDSGQEQWSTLGDLLVECIGISPYPNQIHTRVMGFVRPARPSEVIVNKIHYVRGDATNPRGDGNKIIAQVVNDKTPRWGAGFALAIWRKWPSVQKQFEQWANERKSNLSLGNIHSAEIDQVTVLISMISQRGYGESSKPRIRYSTLKICLEKVAQIAKQWQASIHLPRIGSGQAGGDWRIIEELIEDSLCKQGLKVYVYTLPNDAIKKDPQERFKFD